MRELDRVLESPATLTSYNPATGEALGTVPLMGPEHVAQALNKSREAYQVWKKLGFGGRKQHLLNFRQALVEARDEVAQLLTQENGKPLVESLTEILSACEFLAYYANHAEIMLQDEAIHVVNPVVANKETFLAFEPKGVVAIISPWNYPLLLTMAEASGALAAGNTVIIKPSELTPLLTVKIAEIAQRAGMPDGVFQVVTGDGTTGAALASARVDRVCFTGSVATGKKVAKSAMDRLVPVTLELGGKDPALVLADVDLEFTAQGLVWGAFTNAGQACASVERAYLDSRIAFTLTEKIVERTRTLVVGNGLDPKTEVGPIISEAQLQRIEAQVADAVAKGAKVLCGGQRLPGPGLFYAPTVLADVTPDMLVLQEETFGPILPLITCSNEDEMVALANDSPFGLSATIWTRDTEHGKALAREVQSGSVWVNTGLASYGNPLTPRGGFKESGIGKIGGKHGLLEMVNVKLIDVAEHGKAKDWWYPTWPGAYEYFAAGIDLLHGGTLGRKMEGLFQFLKTRR